MKKRDFEELCKKLLPQLSGFTCKGWLLYEEPVAHVLRGFCCDDSGFDPRKFAVTAFFLPLYVPTNHLHFNMGHRLKDDLGCDIWWNLSDSSLPEELLSRIRRQGLPLLHAAGQPSQVASAIQQLGGETDPYRVEAVAYSLAMADDYAGAQRGLDRLLKTLDVTIGWQTEMMERAKRLGEKLKGSPQSVKQLLAEWERTTVSNLGL